MERGETPSRLSTSRLLLPAFSPEPKPSHSSLESTRHRSIVALELTGDQIGLSVKRRFFWVVCKYSMVVWQSCKISGTKIKFIVGRGCTLVKVGCQSCIHGR